MSLSGRRQCGGDGRAGLLPGQQRLEERNVAGGRRQSWKLRLKRVLESGGGPSSGHRARFSMS